VCDGPGPHRGPGAAHSGMVNSAPGFERHPAVISGFPDLILSAFGA
jgi:hypothetical protein